jgi:fumarylpyruvate hydrolase
MPAYVFPPAPQPAVPVRGEAALFPVRRIFCVGRNYAAHAREMGGDPSREPPFYFTKPADAVLLSGGVMPYPPGTSNLHHEMELVVALGRPAFKVTKDAALGAVFGYACGLDMTRRDLQGQMKDKGRPWDIGKAFDHSAVVSEIVRADETGVLHKGAVTLSVNGQERQRGDLSDMIWNVPEIIADLSRFFHLLPGDLIYTGTPEGVGAVVPGDRIEGRIEGLGSLSLTIGPEA